MNPITIKNRSLTQMFVARLSMFSLAMCIGVSVIGLSACGGGGGLAGDGGDQATDPGTVEYPIAYVRRPAPEMPIPANERSDLEDPFAFSPGAKLFIRSRADSNAKEINLTDKFFPGEETLYDVKDLAVSPDGKNLVFALHAPMLENAEPIDQPSWDIWIYNFETKQIRPVIASKNKSQGSDVAPHFLADGRIVFVSDRQYITRQKLLEAGLPAYSGLVQNENFKAGVLHIMNADGSGISQLSFNQSHDLSPSQLRNGKLVFMRWDNMAGTSQIGMNLYTLNPSGMNLSYLYGYHSHRTGNDPATDVQFSQPREMEDGRIVTILRQSQEQNMGGDLVAIDVEHFSDNAQPTWENASRNDTAQKSLAAHPVHTDGSLSPGGEFGAVWPLFDGTGRLLISWSQCRYLDTKQVIRPCTADTPADADPAPLLYGLWIFDPKAQTQKPIVTPKEGVIYTDIVAASPAKNVATAVDNTAGFRTNDLLDYGNDILNTLATNKTAVLDIRSVYNLDNGIGNFGAAAPADLIANQANPASNAYQTRRARFLQIVEGVPLPDPNDKISLGNDQILRVPNFAFGSGRYLRHIVGYVPIEADGSVVVQVPADVPITFNVLDANAQRLNTNANHNVWLQFRAGEVVRCTGCHSTATANATLTHGRFDSNAPDANLGTTGTGFFADVAVDAMNFASARVGQTMAEVYAANNQNPRTLSLNAYFEDEWATDGNQQNPTIDYRYKNTDAARPLQVPVLPVTSESCLEDPTRPLVPRWNSNCRIIINYLEHVQKIWDRSRPQFDNMGNPVLDANNQQVDNRCTSCHSPTDAIGAAQVPKGQLDLRNTTSDRDNNRVLSYSELFSDDTQQQLTGGVVTDIPPIITSNPDGTTTTTDFPAFHVMNNGARNSPRFFGCFNGGTCGNSGETGFNHAGLLTGAELRLLSEWLDNGAQYYNDVSKAAAAQ